MLQRSRASAIIGHHNVYRPGSLNTTVLSDEAMIEHDPPHPIIDRPYEYRILSLRCETASEAGEPIIDLHLGRGTIVRKLRFWSPQTLNVEEGFPEPTHGMMILDVRARQMDGLGVQVADIEASWGAITFWARDVVDLDTLEAD